MVDAEKFKEIVEFVKSNSYKAASDKYGIPYTTIKNWITRGSVPYSVVSNYDRAKEKRTLYDYISNTDPKELIKSTLGFQNYSYLLGAYLGDGWITKQTTQMKFCICKDRSRQTILDFWRRLLSKIGTVSTFHRKSNCDVLKIALPLEFMNIFPQSGDGFKNLRCVELVSWQYEIIDYKFLLLGLFHTDGSCYKPTPTSAKLVYEFSNTSMDVIKIYKQCLENLGIPFSEYDIKRKTPAKRIVARGETAKRMFSLIGTKESIPEEFFV